MLFTLIMTLMGLAGGGGSSSGGGGSSFSGGSSYSSSSGSGGASDPIALLFFLPILIVIIIVSIKANKSAFQDYNSTTSEKNVHNKAKQIFEAYQSDWSNFNYNGIKTYTTLNYYNHAALMLELLNNLRRVNQVSELKIHEVLLKTPIPDDATFPLHVDVKFIFSATDDVLDTTSNQKLYHSYVSYGTETWNFIYDGKELKLDGISQPTESASHLIRSLATFASNNRLYYSPDWGRYALPARGLIFDKASMKVADINNHVIGKWGNLLVQLYTYAPTPGRSTSSYYLVGQLNVPKDYLGVIVKSKRFKSGMKPDKSYEKFEMEWNDFNDRYEVCAASRDALPAFELLNPKFMEFLYSKNPAYNLEVVDNIIYIYLNIKDVTEADYAELLSVLSVAYSELKM